MNILLVNPPVRDTVLGKSFAAIEEERGLSPPLGLLYVAAAVEAGGGHRVAVLDAQAERLDFEGVGSRLRDAAPDVVGITAMTLTLPDVLATIAECRRHAPHARVVLGGPHVHLFPDETARLDGVDVGVLGEGEGVFPELLDAWATGRPLATVPGLVFRNADGEVVNTGVQPFIDDLDALPFPARHLVEPSHYHSILAAGDIVTTMITSRGCPFACAFCDRPHLGRRFRARSAANVVDEIEECVAMGIDDFLIYDDTFTVDRQRVLNICELIAARRLKVRFDIRARVDTVDDDMLERLRRAGCQGVHYGVEAGTEHVLAALNKRITLDQVREAFRLTRQRRMAVLAYFMIGNPGETRADILTTFNVMRELQPDYVHLTILVPFPGTAVYRSALERGLFATDVWRDFAAKPRPDFELPYWTENLARDELEELVVHGYRSFYLRPAYIAKRLLRLRSFSELRRKFRAGRHVLGMR